MTREQYIDYWVAWLRRTDPSVNAHVVNGAVTMTRAGLTFTGWPQACTCDDPECLGWVMVTLKKKESSDSIRN